VQKLQERDVRGTYQISVSLVNPILKTPLGAVPSSWTSSSDADNFFYGSNLYV